MEIVIGLILSFALLIYSVLKGYFIGYTLVVCWGIFAMISYKKKYSIAEIATMSWLGAKKSFVVLKMFILIGAVIGAWMASGTIPTIVYYCLQYITPSTFVLSAFIICCITSFLIGTSLGTVSTAGIPLMIIARNGDINLNMVAGAIIAGAYFGDRCSPMSSSAALVANLSKTDVLHNIRNMIYTSIVPFALSLGFYYMLSVQHPLEGINQNLSHELLRVFDIGLVMLLPAVMILVLVLFKINIKVSISISILSAAILALVFQHYSVGEVVHYIIFGFKMTKQSSLQNIIKGGGVISMLRASFVIFVSCALAGIFEGIKMLDPFKNILLKLKMARHHLFGMTTLVSIVTGAFGCNQSIAVVMTNEIMKDCYGEARRDALALDMENSGILISALIPWNIAALVPTTTLGVSTTGYLPYAFYLYIFPVVYFIYLRYAKGKEKQNILLQDR